MPFAELTAYFAAEKQGGLLLVAMAAAGIGLAIYLFVTRSAFSAMAWPLLVFGGLELVIGVTVAGRAASQVAELDTGLQTTRRSQTITSEVERMARVNGTFVLVKRVEVALIAISVVFLLVKPAPETLGAVGLGILLQCAALLVFDTFAHHRAIHYVEWLIALPPRG
jgi:uncharacterized membrane protein